MSEISSGSRKSQQDLLTVLAYGFSAPERNLPRIFETKLSNVQISEGLKSLVESCLLISQARQRNKRKVSPRYIRVARVAPKGPAHELLTALNTSCRPEHFSRVGSSVRQVEVSDEGSVQLPDAKTLIYSYYIRFSKFLRAVALAAPL